MAEILTFKDLGAIGIIKDMSPSELPDNAWTNGNNVVFRDGIAQRIPGESDIFPGSTYSPESLLFYPDPQSGTAYWLYAGFDATDMRILNWDGTSHTDISGAAVGDPYGTSHNGWTKGSCAGIPFFNNGIGAPWLWLRSVDGTNLDATMTQMTSWPAGMTAEQVRSFGNFYVALDIKEVTGPRNPSRLMWSHPAEPYLEPSSWDITDASKLAGDVILGDTSDYLMDCLPLRDINIIYKRNETWTMRRVNTNAVFVFKRLFKDVGMLSPRCAEVVKGTYHFLVTNDKDIVLHDGNTRKSIVDKKNRTAIFNEIDEENLTRCFVKANKTQEEIWFCYPTRGNTRCNRAAIWNYESDVWSFRDLNKVTDMEFGIPVTNVTASEDSWDGGPDTSWDAGADIPWSAFFSSILLSSEVMCQFGNFVKPDDTFTFSGVKYTGYLERTGLDLGDLSRTKLIKSILPKVRGGPIDISIGSSHNIDGPYTWTAPKSFDTAIDYKVDVRKSGRFFGFRFTSLFNFRIDEYGINVIDRGKR